jgi:hypothetical protein
MPGPERRGSGSPARPQPYAIFEEPGKFGGAQLQASRGRARGMRPGVLHQQGVMQHQGMMQQAAFKAAAQAAAAAAAATAQAAAMQQGRWVGGLALLGGRARARRRSCWADCGIMHATVRSHARACPAGVCMLHIGCEPSVPCARSQTWLQARRPTASTALPWTAAAAVAVAAAPTVAAAGDLAATSDAGPAAAAPAPSTAANAASTAAAA